MLTLLLAVALVSGDVIHDFDREDAARFVTVNDTVMGGRSDARIQVLEGGVLRFSGTLSLENNGGFTSLRSRIASYVIDDSDGIELRVRGDGRTYTFSLDISGVPIPAGGYWQEFTTRAGEWQTVRLPYDDFVPISFGRELKGLPAVTADRIDGVAVYLADKQPGAFAIELDSIGTYSGDAPPSLATSRDAGLLPVQGATLATPQARVRDVFAGAIARGVPLFNDGNVEACAAVYRTAVEATLTLSAAELDAGSLEVLRRALTKAEHETARSAAWTRRDAMDAVLLEG